MKLNEILIGNLSALLGETRCVLGKLKYNEVETFTIPDLQRMLGYVSNLYTEV